MSSVHCTDCPNYDETMPAVCCSSSIRPARNDSDKSHNIINMDKPLHATLVNTRPAVLSGENWGNC